MSNIYVNPYSKKKIETGSTEFPYKSIQKVINNVKVDKQSWFYKNCKRQRKNKAKICNTCPFKECIEK